MYDVALYYREKTVVIDDRDFILLTYSSGGNTDDPNRLEAIVTAINKIPDRWLIFPAHPRTVKMLKQQGLNFDGYGFTEESFDRYVKTPEILHEHYGGEKRTIDFFLSLNLIRKK
jgi:hypothetical protein